MFRINGKGTQHIRYEIVSRMRLVNFLQVRQSNLLNATGKNKTREVYIDWKSYLNTGSDFEQQLKEERPKTHGVAHRITPSEFEWRKLLLLPRWRATLLECQRDNPRQIDEKTIGAKSFSFFLVPTEILRT